MLEYFGLFLETPAQIVVLAACLLLWVAFSAAGGLILRGDRLIEADVISGWAVANLVFTLGGVFTGVPMTWMAAGLGIFGAMAIYMNMRDGARFVAPAFPKLVVCVLPLLVLAAAMQGSQWDEFTDWLLIPRYLHSLEHLPSHANPYEGASFPGYPFGWHYVSYLVAEMTGAFRESAAPVFNILLLMGLATLVVRLVARAMGNDQLALLPAWGLAALAALAVTALNPTFVQKVVITSYADTSTAVVTAFAAIIGWLLVEALTVADRRRARRLAIQLGLALAVLVNLKQATFALFLLMAMAPFVVALRDRLIPFREILRYALYIVGPGLVIYFAWRHHVNTQITHGEFPLRSLTDWYFDILPEILGRMIAILAKKGYYFACILAIAVFGIRGLIRSKTSEDRLLTIAAFAILGYNGFLLTAYLGAFPRGESIVAASFWRYNHHLGGIVVVTVAYLIAAHFGPKIAAAARNRRWLAVLPVVLVVAFPLAFAEKFRFDLLPRLQYFRAVAADARTLMPDGANYMAIDPTGNGESAAAALFETAGHQHQRTYRAGYQTFKANELRDLADRLEIRFLLIHSPHPDVEAWTGKTLSKELSYLLERDGNGWKTVKTWTWPAQRGK